MASIIEDIKEKLKDLDVSQFGDKKLIDKAYKLEILIKKREEFKGSGIKKSMFTRRVQKEFNSLVAACVKYTGVQKITNKKIFMPVYIPGSGFINYDDLD